MSTEQRKDIIMHDEKCRGGSASSLSKEEAGIIGDTIDKSAERAYGTTFPIYRYVMTMF
jgi:hypothetical protein